MTLLEQDVVRCAGDHPDRELIERVVVDDPAEGVRGEDIDVARVDRVRVDSLHAVCVLGPLHLRGVDVGHDHMRACFGEQPECLRADDAEPLKRDAAPA